MVLKVFTFFVALSLSSSFSQAAVLQEGWYKIISGGQHVGFIALRYEFNDSKKQFTATAYTQTNPLAGNLKESLTAVATQSLDPVSYQYISTIGQLVKTIDASFSKGVMSAKLTEAGKPISIQNKLQKGTFLSQFLIYLILQNPKGMKVGNKFAYNAISEEDGKIQDGEAYISGMEKVNGIDAYKVLNTFKGAKYISFVTPKGIMLLTKDPVQSLSTELVGSMEEAVKGFDVNKKTLTLLFKTLPGTSLPKPETPVTPPSEPNIVDNAKMKKLQEGTDTSTPKGVLIPPGKGAVPSNDKEPDNGTQPSKGK